ncbi:MAG: hypothetical protein IPO21_08685 [Bacteroidales bacterium]|nr:hypothetical protein [Bacteroidales bacterium]
MPNKEHLYNLLKTLNEIDDYCARFVNYEKIPQIEIDLILSKTRQFYDGMVLLEKLNKEDGLIDEDIDFDFEAEETAEIALAKKKEVKETKEASTVIINAPLEQPKDIKKEAEIEPQKKEILIEELKPVKEEVIVVKSTILQETPPLEIEKKTTVVEQEVVKPEIKNVLKTEVVTEVVPKEENKKLVNEPAPKIKQEKGSLRTDDIVSKNSSGAFIAQKLQMKPIKTMNEAIGINDKFQYIRELFGGLADEYSKTIEVLNKVETFDEALTYIESRFEWDQEDKTVLKFLEIVNRRFIK